MEVRKEPAKVEPFTLTVDDAEWETRQNMSAPRPQSIHNQAEIEKQVNKLLDLGVIEYSQEAYNSQVLLTDKSNGKKRFCIDFRNLNKASKSFGWPLPNINHMLRRIGEKNLNSLVHSILLRGITKSLWTRILSNTLPSEHSEDVTNGSDYRLVLRLHLPFFNSRCKSY